MIKTRQLEKHAQRPFLQAFVIDVLILALLLQNYAQVGEAIWVGLSLKMTKNKGILPKRLRDFQPRQVVLGCRHVL